MALYKCLYYYYYYYKMLHGKSAVNFSRFFEMEESCRTRGHSYKLKKRRLNTDLRQHFSSERIVNFWKKVAACRAARHALRAGQQVNI